MSAADAIERVVADVCAKLGLLDFMVKNAGVYPPALLIDLVRAALHRVMQINLEESALLHAIIGDKKFESQLCRRGA